MRSYILKLLSVLIVLTCICSPGELFADYHRSVVLITSRVKQYDYSHPWADPGISPRPNVGTGFVIRLGETEPARLFILTNAHVVGHSAFVGVHKRKSTERIAKARVVQIDFDVDLALLSVDAKFLEGMIPLELSKDLPDMQSAITVLGYPQRDDENYSDELSTSDGIVSSFKMEKYSLSQQQNLVVRINSPINAGNSGGPAIDKLGKVVGIVMQKVNARQNFNEMLPVVPVVDHFLKECSQGTYRGFPDLGLTLKTIPVSQREHYRLPKGETGLVVADTISPYSDAFGILKVDDVITKINEAPVGADGNVIVNLSYLHPSFYIRNAYIGQALKFTVRRNGEPKTLEILLKKRGSDLLLVPEVYVHKPTYYIYGGFVFQPLTTNYLRTFENWRTAEETAEMRQYLGRLKERSGQQIVVMTRILNDEHNADYSEENLIVEAVNGRNIDSMHRLLYEIENTKRPDGSSSSAWECREVKITVRGSTQPIVINRANAELTRADIMENNEVLRGDRSDDLKNITAPGRYHDDL